MMKFATLLVSSVLVRLTFSHLTSNKFPGYGFAWYDPNCGFACYSAISSAILVCTEMDHSGSDHSGMSMSTSDECRAGDMPFLTTLAYCMKTYCGDKTPVWKREKYWGDQATGGMGVPAKWTYSQALAEIIGTPTAEFNASSDDPLGGTMVVPKATYETQSVFNERFDHMEMLQARYIFVLLAIGVGTPIFTTLLARLPFMTRTFEKIRPYVVYPSIIGTYNIRPLPWLIGNAPTVGQTLYIVVFFALNLILSSVNYKSSQPHPWGFAKRDEMLSYIGYRTGHIGYALLPLLILFSGRNNFLLWITDWPHSTYILLHRWIARIFALQAIIHSITLLMCYSGSGSYPVESKLPYWRWGIVATVLTVAMLFLSHLYLRRLSYEFFLILHIVLGVFVIAGCWYHVILRWDYQFYDNWLYAAIAVWFFDRLVRVLRIAKNGIRRATVTNVGPDHVRVDIPGIRFASRPGYVAYAHFPTLNPLRPWENHPFSINSTTIFRSYGHAIAPLSTSLTHSTSDGGNDVEKSAGKVTETSVPNDGQGRNTSGVTLIVKKSAGLTRLLRSHSELMTLLDGPYPQNSGAEVLKCDHILLLGGGVGITGLLPWIQAHPNVKLAWSVKSRHEALVKELEVVLANVADKEVLIGERLNIEALLRAEAEAGYSKVGVIVCAPGSMCDEVRALVVGLGRAGKTVFELEVDAFSW